MHLVLRLQSDGIGELTVVYIHFSQEELATALNAQRLDV